ncbi:hypothetical protein [Deinococcus maricopensis]|uniref:Uncharacterized protein n=1 Tax=Deinococcus maricopensis (strain DSM 21211 / LMG 22137 / NRRL B-23946 / LB-34) TaxID=709986 RepID=E8UAZ4_DEIML|nr:hypothetical protein [Deinococcus maricopensis]ADV68233.1 hypothetical protein Deima_2600 [Deinococcus maricopensis DSM 21211]
MKNWMPAVLALTLGSAAFAHELVRDGQVGGLIHIEPDDAPVVGKNKVWFELTQRGGRAITAANCTCTLSVYAGSVKAGVKPLSTVKLSASGARLGATVTLPRDGAYTLLVTGTARAGATFGTFKLPFVTRTGTQDHDHG